MPADEAIARLLARIRTGRPSALEAAFVEAISMRDLAESFEGVPPILRERLAEHCITLSKAVAEQRQREP